ncbi:VOC family protein [Candidatus Deferrimicrobium sp.]|uniref:VOC family protein n=1 Tax=Candidatus Deferrimicrobium sp. TaxID=3060586 RepID=UPI002ED66B1F
MANPFVHVELMIGDVEKAKAFYGALFDWKLEDVPGMNYTIVKVGEGTGGGMVPCPEQDTSSQWLPYIHVKDVAETLARAPGARRHRDEGCHRGARNEVVRRPGRLGRRRLCALAAQYVVVPEIPATY